MHTKKRTKGNGSATASFLGALFRGAFRFTPTRLLVSILAAVVAFAVHWFFLVVVNEGFGMGKGNWYNGLLVFARGEGRGFWRFTRTVSAVLAIPSVLYVLTVPLSRFARNGFGKTVLGWLREVPRAVRYATGRHGAARLLRYWLGAVAGVALALVFQNPIFGLAVSVGLFFSASYGMSGVGVALLYCIRTDVTPVDKRKSSLFVADNPCAVLDGMSLGWLAGSLPFFVLERGATGIGWVVAILAAPLVVWGVVRLLRNRHTAAGRIGLFLLAYLASTTLLRIWADDGGWSEAGGNFFDWLFSPGASLASFLGLGPSAASFLAIAIGFIPGVGTALDIVSALTGRDLVTGEKLSASDRFMNLIGLGLPFFDSRLGDLFGHGKTASDLGSALDGLGGGDGDGGTGGDGESGAGGHGDSGGVADGGADGDGFGHSGRGGSQGDGGSIHNDGGSSFGGSRSDGGDDAVDPFDFDDKDDARDSDPT